MGVIEIGLIGFIGLLGSLSATHLIVRGIVQQGQVVRPNEKIGK